MRKRQRQVLSVDVIESDVTRSVMITTGYNLLLRQLCSFLLLVQGRQQTAGTGETMEHVTVSLRLLLTGKCGHVRTNISRLWGQAAYLVSRIGLGDSSQHN